MSVSSSGITHRIQKLLRSYELRKESVLNEDILPRRILKKRVIIKTNGNIVFDSYETEGHRIPPSIQYTIKKYGIPRKRDIKGNQPIIYEIDSRRISI